MWQNLGVDFSEVEKTIVKDQGHTWIKVGLDNSDCFYESIFLRLLNTKRVIFGRWQRQPYATVKHTLPFWEGSLGH